MALRKSAGALLRVSCVCNAVPCGPPRLKRRSSRRCLYRMSPKPRVVGHGTYPLSVPASLRRVRREELCQLVEACVNDTSMAQILTSIELPSSTEVAVDIKNDHIRGSKLLEHFPALMISMAELGRGEIFRRFNPLTEASRR
ncbi:hypothetical protein M407DRAFT_11370 [Tulasnella calospora MUT 4182]|uniref:Uncharacterized protein n=1 Tax=Tulasnella calospora MUT 4182 TaxID=1051891 RepID=A0A0C3Q7G6_9AGAM|nr:hypothetical protein M407DRAFT_11370 [Tulasnella calospora MUT 4182]